MVVIGRPAFCVCLCQCGLSGPRENFVIAATFLGHASILLAVMASGATRHFHSCCCGLLGWRDSFLCLHGLWGHASFDSSVAPDFLAVQHYRLSPQPWGPHDDWFCHWGLWGPCDAVIYSRSHWGYATIGFDIATFGDPATLSLLLSRSSGAMQQFNFVCAAFGATPCWILLSLQFWPRDNRLCRRGLWGHAKFVFLSLPFLATRRGRLLSLPLGSWNTVAFVLAAFRGHTTV